MKIILMARLDGTMFTRTPVGPVLEDETEDQYLDRLSQANKKGASKVAVMDHAELPAGHQFFKDARRWDGAKVTVDMPVARAIHAERIAEAQVAEVARLKVAERASRITGNTSQAEAQAATVVALEALDLNVLATRIAKAPNPTALKAVQ